MFTIPFNDETTSGELQVKAHFFSLRGGDKMDKTGLSVSQSCIHINAKSYYTTFSVQNSKETNKLIWKTSGLPLSQMMKKSTQERMTNFWKQLSVLTQSNHHRTVAELR